MTSKPLQIRVRRGGKAIASFSGRELIWLETVLSSTRDLAPSRYKSIEYPKLIAPNGRKCNHGVIVKLVSTNICGSDLHMYRGRTSAPKGTVFGHENTGEVIEIGSDVECVKVGDIVSIPFNIARGRCRNCKARFTNLCINTSPAGIGGAYGFVGMGGWLGGQAEYIDGAVCRLQFVEVP
jgi:threonine dehydrogenase-like Zn-dependent dehydrogenase